MFSEWLADELATRAMRPADLARKSGLSRSAISNYLKQQRNTPEPEALVAIARALRLPAETVYQAAGILPQPVERTELIAQLIKLFEQLPPADQDDILHYIDYKITRRIQQEKKPAK